ncbi:MAG TPA: glycosyltransferase [Polyangia bacterium]|nr:glycosyltransferase [Polyangia bacterium]
MKVSIITPCYNDGRFLDEAVRSVEAQTFADWELLIVDDGSTDPETQRILQDWNRPKTRLLRVPHGGVTAARNFAIQEAAGEYLTFFDCDDRLHPQFLEKTVGRLEAEPRLAFVSFYVHLHGDEAWDWKPERCDLVTLLGDCSVATAAVVRRAAVLEVGGFDRAMELGHEDWDLWLSLVERGHPGAIIPEILFHYRRRPRSRSTIADHGATYLELFRDRVRKHQASYQKHLFELLWQKEQDIQSYLDGLDAARANFESSLAPAVVRRREELKTLRRAALDAMERRLDEAYRQLDDTRAALDHEQSTPALRLPGPLRDAFEWARRRKEEK